MLESVSAFNHVLDPTGGRGGGGGGGAEDTCHSPALPWHAEATPTDTDGRRGPAHFVLVLFGCIDLQEEKRKTQQLLLDRKWEELVDLGQEVVGVSHPTGSVPPADGIRPDRPIRSRLTNP